MIAYHEALAAYASLRPAAPRALALARASGAWLAQPLLAERDVPQLAQSAMDGWACRAQDALQGAWLLVVGQVWPGQDPSAWTVEPGQAVQIATGACLPPGADAILRREDAARDPAAPERVQVLRPLTVGADVRARGELLAQGQPLSPASQRVSAGLLAAASMQGMTHLQARRPRVCLLVSGDEVIAPGQPGQPWQLYDGNSAPLQAGIQALGGELTRFERLPDARDGLRDALAAALEDADLVLTTGAASVGERDWWRGVGAELGVALRFEGVAQRPGKPLFFGISPSGAAWLGLPGTPLAVLTALGAHVTPLMACLGGAQPDQSIERAALTSPAPTHPSMTRHELAQRLTPQGRPIGFAPLGAMPVHAQMALATHVLVIGPGERALPPGALVDAWPLPHGSSPGADDMCDIRSTRGPLRRGA